LEALERLPCPVVDRAALEILFGVSRRTAIRLMSQFGGYRSGKTYLVGREELLRQLRGWTGSHEFERGKARRRRVGAMAEDLARSWTARQTVISPPREPVKGLENLPEGVRLGEQKLEIDFDGQEDLLTKLLALVQGLARHLS
jgi:hypothetical protein